MTSCYSLEQNHFESRTWNLKTPGFSYTEGVKRPGQSPTEGDSPPHTKRKLTVGESNTDIPPIRQFFLHSQGILDLYFVLCAKIANFNLMHAK